jgi:phospholipase/carboxylesterase
VVESDGLENRYRSNPIEGSNPSLSAHTWASAEIGRQAGLRSPCSQERVGSSPTSPTMRTNSSGRRPLVSFSTALLICGLYLIAPLDIAAQKRASSAGSVGVGSAAAPVPAPSPLDTSGLWHFVEQRRIGRYKVRLPRTYATSSASYRLVVLLHGNGNNPQMLLDWFGGLGLDSLVVVAPEAPYTKIPETVTSGRGAYAGVADANWAPDSVRAESIVLTADWYAMVIDNAMAQLRVDTARPPLVVGFSQGGYFAHVLMVRSQRPLAGVATICASNYPQYDVLQRFNAMSVARPPVFLAHGQSDAVVPPRYGAAYRSALETSGFSLMFLPFDGGHWPTPAVDAALRNWIMSIIR